MKKLSAPLSGRRQFLGSVAKIAALGSLNVSPLPSLAASQSEDNNTLFLTQPYLQSIDATSISVRLITAQPTYCWVEYGTTGEFNQKAHAITDGLVNAFNRIHEIRIDGLLPGTKYNYRVAAKEILQFQPYKVTYGEVAYSDAYSMNTIDPAAQEVNWLVLNDIHDRPESFRHLMDLNGNDHYDYVFLNGDMFDYQTDEKQLIDHLIAPCTSCFATQKPMMFVRGNHETRGKFARNLKDYFGGPAGQYFTFKWGPVFGIALDTGEDKNDDHPVYAGIVDFDTYRIRQAAWLEAQLQSRAARKAKYRVVMMHIPPFYSGDGHGTLHCRELFSPIFDKYDVDLVICGHTHAYGVYPPVSGSHKYPIIIGGGPKDGKRTLIKVKANAQQLSLSMLRDDGAVVGTYIVS